MLKNKIITYFIGAVWLANGLFCKLLNWVPRHQQIVARIIGDAHAGLLTRLIGVAETMMAIWILSGWRPRLNAITQMAIIAAMNTLEFLLAPDLLLWGRFNALFAFLFILLIYYHEFFKEPSLSGSSLFRELRRSDLCSAEGPGSGPDPRMP